eukprot:CAMPEP_0180328920 /NCGR_PEP_ID=MMETSP0988-20121125/40483_1 /TAXON_ID=697907 /ORGANISM="non described non described, Strain CCMP2293" /LENGTH=56 /DNA_ID=CAMNT_0022315985 /DNA_START=233 /DNA_END=403 /DNA_ORIENTATION=+
MLSTSTVQKNTGGGISIPASLTTGLSPDATSVSPVRVFDNPTSAAMSPARNSSMSS